jgi:isopentenyl diphosphate isomerase/L-lactate dehydrogenase-like FMN-dependent dehydrogenase
VTGLEPVADLGGIVRLDEFAPLAAERMDLAAYDYVAGGAWDERSVREGPEAWARRRLRPRVLVDVADVVPATTALGKPISMPVAIAPMAAQGMAHDEGERAVAAAAASAGIPMIVSTMSTWSLEDVAAAAPGATRWFQLYTQADPGRSRRLVERAEAAGYGAIVVTVDLPVLGYRERDLRSGFNLSVTLGNFVDEPPTHASHGATGSGSDILTADLDRGLTWAGIDAIRSWTALPIVLKGILTAEDARLAVEHGVAGIVVSNHGARQLDRTVATADALEPIVEAVDAQAEVWVDGGIRRGLDVVTALALGARGVLVGRPVFWALAAAGRAGVERALAILRTETVLAMTLLGASRPEEIVRAHVAD